MDAPLQIHICITYSSAAAAKSESESRLPIKKQKKWQKRRRPQWSIQSQSTLTLEQIRQGLGRFKQATSQETTGSRSEFELSFDTQQVRR
jgi:hypothetical protein